MHYKTPKNRNEIMLYPQVDLWISKDNDVRIIDKIIDQIITSNADQYQWKGTSKKGCTSYSPQTMHKLLLYGYFNWIAGSRRLERETYRNLELLWLLGDLHPDHWTICEFRRDNKEQIRNIAIEFRKFLNAAGYIGGKKIAMDGSKVKANASRDMFTEQSIKNRLDNIETQLTSYLENSEETDQLEEQAENDDAEKKKLKDDIEKLEKEKNRLQQINIQLIRSGAKNIALNDPDAKLMKSRDGFMPCYNVQTSVDSKNKLIVMATATTEQADIDQLKGNLEIMKQELNIVPQEVQADKGYANAGQIQEAEKNGIDCYIPMQRSAQKEKDKDNDLCFRYNKENDQYICPENKILSLKSRLHKRRKRVYNIYQCNDCNNCPGKGKCTTSKYGRIIKRDIETDWIESYKAKIDTQKGKEYIHERRTIVEHPFGTIKRIMGKMSFLLTGKECVQSEIDLYTTVYNLKRIINIDDFDTLMIKIAGYNWKMR